MANCLDCGRGPLISSYVYRPGMDGVRNGARGLCVRCYQRSRAELPDDTGPLATDEQVEWAARAAYGAADESASYADVRDLYVAMARAALRAAQSGGGQ